MYDFPKLFSDEIFKHFIIGNTAFALFIWVFNLVTKNISHMDRLWAILPNVYSWLFIYTAIAFNPKTESDKTYSVLKSDEKSLARLYLMSALMALWGVRLVYVFWRRGYYSLTHEDHRWEHIKKKLGYPEKKLAFHIYNFVLMAFIQNWILIGHALPMWFIQTNTSSDRISAQQPLNTLDIVNAVFFVIFFIFEYIGDEQQWNFQTRKYKWIEEVKENKDVSHYSPEEIEDFKRGFICKGIFAYSRHPNYFGELFLWISIWAFTLTSQYTVFATEGFKISDFFNYAVYSSLVMSFLFSRSYKVTEKISLSKYPAYKHYQENTNAIFPSLIAYVPKKIE